MSPIKKRELGKVKIIQFISSQRADHRNPLPAVASLPSVPANSPAESTTNSTEEGSPEGDALERVEESR